MARSDYAHHNEEADMIWWEEEGKHSVHVDHYDPDDDNYDAEWKEAEHECQEDSEATQEADNLSG